MTAYEMRISDRSSDVCSADLSPCRSCRGEGRVDRPKTLSVNIPAGVDEGTRIRLSGEGEAGARGAPAGDLYIFLHVKRHPIFERDRSEEHTSELQSLMRISYAVFCLKKKKKKIHK